MFPTERFTTASLETGRSKATRDLTGFQNLSGLRTPLDAPLLLFLLTALLGVWTAYDTGAARFKLGLIAGGLLLFYLLAFQRDDPARQRLIGGALAGAAPFAAGYFLLTQVEVPLPHFHPNVMAGVMVMLVPYTLAFAVTAWARWRAGGQFVAVGTLLLTAASLLLTAVALLLSASRGAILSLLFVTCLWILWRLRKRVLLLLSAGPVILAGLVIGLPLLLSRFSSITDTLIQRSKLFRQTLYLIADFPFTGAGLGSFPGLYSEYILDIPYYMLPSSHNLLLDVALEQGLLGLLAFCALILGTLYLLLRGSESSSSELPPEGDVGLSPAQSSLRLAAVASTAILLIHGLIDDPIYSSKALPLLFIAPGIAVACYTHRSTLHPTAPSRTRRALPAVSALATLFLVAVALVFPSSARQVVDSLSSRFYSNLGAVEMARVQLSEWPTSTWRDGSEAAFLGTAETHFHRSLGLDPGNRTARHRLGLIAMLRYDYATAFTHLSIAHRAGPDHDGIRKALGYSYLWSGQPVQALEHLQGLSGIRGEMQAYSSWWRQQEHQELAELARTMLTLLEETASVDET